MKRCFLLALALTAACARAPERQAGTPVDTTSAAPAATVADSNAFRTIAAGQSHACALTYRGAAYCWGYNIYGQLGIGSADREAHPAPVPVAGGIEFRTITAGRAHTCALTEDGTAYCWGVASDSQLGAPAPYQRCSDPDGFEPCRTQPTAVTGSMKFQAIGAGSTHTCALAPDGIAYCWGGNRFRRFTPLGRGSATTMCEEVVTGEGGGGTESFPCGSNAPVRVAGAPAFRSLAVGLTHSCGLTAEGAVYCWGSNEFGDLGNGSTAAADSAVRVVGDLVFNSIGVAARCGLTADGRLYCWGINQSGWLGVDSTPETCRREGGYEREVREPCSTRPLPVAAPTFRSLAGDGACALTGAGGAYCWPGGGEFAAPGLKRVAEGGSASVAPQPVAPGLTFRAISRGLGFACGLTGAGEAYCWGSNFEGQLGNGTTTRSGVPVLVNRVPPAQGQLGR